MTAPKGTENPLQRLTSVWKSSRSCVRFVLALTATYLLTALLDPVQWQQGDPTDPLWPFRWLTSGTYQAIWLTITLTGGVAAALAAWKLNSGFLRPVVAIALFLHLSLIFSFGQIRHNQCALLWINILFALIPAAGLSTDTPISVIRRRECVRIVGIAQSLFLLFYSMAGLYKLCRMLQQEFLGQISILYPEAAARIVADWLIRDSQSAPLAEFIIQWPLLSHIGLIVCTLAEAMAIAAVFTSRLQVAIGLVLFAMHVGILFSLNIGFYLNAILLLRFIVLGPQIARKSANS